MIQIDNGVCEPLGRPIYYTTNCTNPIDYMYELNNKVSICELSCNPDENYINGKCYKECADDMTKIVDGPLYKCTYNDQ